MRNCWRLTVFIQDCGVCSQVSSSIFCSDWEELREQTPKPHPHDLLLNGSEELWGIPEHIDRGYGCDMELLPGVWLFFSDREFHQDWALPVPAHDHLIEQYVLKRSP